MTPAYRLRSLLLEALVPVDEFVDDGDPAQLRANRQLRERIDGDLARLHAHLMHDPEARLLIEQARTDWSSADRVAAEILSVRRPGGDAHGVELRPRFHGLIESAVDKLGAAAADLERELQCDHDRALLFYERTGWISGIGGAVSLCAILIAVVGIGRVVSASVDRLVQGAERFASGDRAHRIDVQVPPELHSVAEEFNRMIVRIHEYLGAVWKNEQGQGEWTGEDLKDIIWLMVYTGYRISDAVFFDMSRLRGDQVLIRAQKNGKQVFGVLPDWICNRLLARAKVHGARPFLVGRSRRLESVTDVWRRRIAQAFAAAGEFEQTPTPHRGRHTFARILLEKGVSIADVAELMGDDEETVRVSYSAWVPERQNRRTAILRNAFDDSPKLVGIRGRRA